MVYFIFYLPQVGESEDILVCLCLLLGTGIGLDDLWQGTGLESRVPPLECEVQPSDILKLEMMVIKLLTCICPII